MTRWTVVPQNVTRMPRLSYMVPMDAGAAAAQVYNMENRNNFNYNSNFMSANEQILADKVDDALYRADSANFAASDILTKLGDILKGEALIYIIASVLVILIILVQSGM